MTEESEWITLATTPPSSVEAMDKLAKALADAKIETSLEENPVRQCERDPAAWLRVHPRDLSLAWDLARKMTRET
jgi:hypothetical protein